METKHLSYFKVENFKRFDSLEVSDIGQFNLIVGDNNVGKTTLLEALLFDDDFQKYQMCLWEVLRTFRDIAIPDTKLIHFLDYYLRDNNKPIIFNYVNLGSPQLNVLELSKRNLDKLTPEEVQIFQRNFDFRPGVRLLTQFTLNGNKELKFIPNDSESLFFFREIPFISYYFLNDFSNVDSYSLLAVNTQKKAAFIEELRYFIPMLQDVEINNALVPDRAVIAIREFNKNLMPLSQYGDGAAKFFRCLLELDKFGQTRLMIDEIDTGIHYSRMKEFLKKIIQTAKNKNVQIFATTHSKECLGYYTQALEELGMQDEGRIIRLADTKSGIKAYTMRFAEFDNALSGDNEIR